MNQPWIETTAKVTTCTYRTDPLRAMAFGFPTTKNFRITFDYYAHGRLYSDQFRSAKSIPQNDPIPLSYNPLDPAQNSLTNTPTPTPAGKPPILAITISGTVLLAAAWLLSLRGCHLPESTAHSTHPFSMSTAIHPDVQVGHVHLKVANLDRALAFYVGVLGLELTQRIGDSAAFLSAGGYHHHIGLNTWESLGSTPPPPGHTGLYHLALLYPTRASLGDALRRLLAAKVPLDGASDHGVSEALYLRDPDQNGVELYHDRPRDQWPRNPDGKIAMVTARLDLQALLNEAG